MANIGLEKEKKKLRSNYFFFQSRFSSLMTIENIRKRKRKTLLKLLSKVSFLPDMTQKERKKFF
jgi:hypothetical protein